MLGRHSCSFAAILATLASLATSQAAPKTCKGGGKIDVEVSYDVSYPIFTYHLSEPKFFSSARIEVWDRPLRLSMTQVPVQMEGQIEWAPKKDPPDTPSELLISIVDPRRSGNVPSVVIGNENGCCTSPSFQNQSFILEEGSGSGSLTIQGTTLSPVNHFLLSEQEPPGIWIAREHLSGVLVDLEHVTVEIPSGYLSRPTVLNLQSMPPDLIHPGEQASPSSSGSITVHIVSKDRPVLTGIDPPEISADAAAAGLTVLLLGSGFTPQSQAVTFLAENAHDLATKTVFVSPNELQVSVDAAYSGVDSDSTRDDRIQFWVRNGDDLHVSDAQELRIVPTAKHPSHAKLFPVITSTSPYPVPLMDFQSPDFLPLTVYGDNFRDDDYIILDNGDRQWVNLKTEFISSHELHVRIPRELWKDHRLSYRLVTQTALGTCSVERWEDE